MRSIISNASTLRSDERDQIAERLTRRLNVAYEALLSKRLFQLMNPEEVGRLSADGVDFQLHMHCHRVPMDHDLFVREIKENRQCIPNMTGIEAVHFCYPSGAYRHTFLPWLKEQRIVSATTWGLASPHDHSLLLPRIVNSGAMSPIELESALAGMSAR